MGLFSFFSLNPEKTEQKGDRYTEQKEYGAAKIEFERLLDHYNKKAPEDSLSIQRVTDKYIGVKDKLALTHLKNGDEMLEAGLNSDAENLFKLSLELTSDSEIRSLLEKRLNTLIIKPANHHIPVIQNTSTPEEQETKTFQDEFLILSGTLGDEIADIYHSYGSPFIEGFVLLSRGNFQEAADHLEEAGRATNDNYGYIGFELAKAYYNLNRIEETETLLFEFMDRQKDSLEGIDLLCDVLCIQKKYQEAEALINSIPEPIHSHPVIILNTGKLFALQKKHDQARKTYSSFLENEWDDDIARGLSGSMELSGDIEGARNLYGLLINQCTSCGQKAHIQDRLKYADLSFRLADFSDQILNLFLEIAREAPETKQFCYERVSQIYMENGDEQEAERYRIV